MSLSRKTFFVAGASVAAAGLAAAGSARATTPDSGPEGRPYAPLLVRGQYDHAAMMRVIDDPQPNKQLFLTDPGLLAAPGVAAAFMKMTNAWNAYTFSLQPLPARSPLAVAAVLIAAPVVFALDDATWAKYRIGDVLGITDRNGATALANPTRLAWGPLDLGADPNDPSGVYHDYSSAALLARGARFLVCHNAIAGISAKFVASSGLSHPQIVDDWTAHVLPGFSVVPAGAMVVQLAQEHGWKLYPITD
jgi:hypothetical protein